MCVIREVLNEAGSLYKGNFKFLASRYLIYFLLQIPFNFMYIFHTHPVTAYAAIFALIVLRYPLWCGVYESAISLQDGNKLPVKSLFRFYREKNTMATAALIGFFTDGATYIVYPIGVALFYLAKAIRSPLLFSFSHLWMLTSYIVPYIMTFLVNTISYDFVLHNGKPFRKLISDAFHRMKGYRIALAQLLVCLSPYYIIALLRQLQVLQMAGVIVSYTIMLAFFFITPYVNLCGMLFAKKVCGADNNFR